MLLQENARQKEIRALEKIESTAIILNQLVDFLTRERKEGDATIKEILLSNHPLITTIRKIMEIPYRVLFENIREMNALLGARKTLPIKRNSQDPALYLEYKSDWFKTKKVLKVQSGLFDELGNMRFVKTTEWKDEFVLLEDFAEDDDLPF